MSGCLAATGILFTDAAARGDPGGTVLVTAQQLGAHVAESDSDPNLSVVVATTTDTALFQVFQKSM
jgi:hypothetical protein